MLIYRLIFGTDHGQVLCAFHDDSRTSAGIGPNGEYNCFACGAKAHNVVGFIAKYFAVGIERAKRIYNAMERIQKYTYHKQPLTIEQRNYLRSTIGLSDALMDKYFFCAGSGKLIYNHTWNGTSIGYTWFNNPNFSNHNVSAPKYKYDKNNIGGSLSPYDDVVKYNSLLLCEGEKDMLTAKAFGIKNAVAKIGGAATWAIGGKNLENKSIAIVYDCDDPGREGAIKDATQLTNRFDCKVKVVDLGLKDGEDVNDFFIKYKKSKKDLIDLIANTPVFIPKEETPRDKVLNYVESLSDEDFKHLEDILKIKKEKENETKS